MAEHKRTRLGLGPLADSDPWPPTSYESRRQPVDAIDEITVQFEEASAIRLLMAADDPEKNNLACLWAQEWVDRTTWPSRPQALLQARRSLGASLSAAGHVDEGEDHDRDRRSAVRAVGDVALPRRRRSVRRRSAFAGVLPGRAEVGGGGVPNGRRFLPISSTKAVDAGVAAKRI